MVGERAGGLGGEDMIGANVGFGAAVAGSAADGIAGFVRGRVLAGVG